MIEKKINQAAKDAAKKNFKKELVVSLQVQKKAYLFLSCSTRAILLGSLLGDGSLLLKKNYKNANFVINHSACQKEYALWKFNQLKTDLSGLNSILEYTEKPSLLIKKPIYKIKYSSKYLPGLTYLFNLVKKNNKICIKRKWLNLLTPLSLAIWWCDDGSLVCNTRQGVFCTEGFSLKDIQVLQKYLDIVWKIKTKIYSQKKFKKNGNERFRLWLVNSTELKKFLRIILPYIPVYSMLYKVILLYKDTELQQRWISEIAENTNFTLSEIQEIVKTRKSQLKAFSENDIVQGI